MKTKHDWSAADALTDEEIHAAALADPDAQPLTDERLAKMQRVPRTRGIRRALGLSQEEFATRYHIPLGTLRDWEQGRREPDQPARAYLKVIAADPDIRYAAVFPTSMSTPTASDSRMANQAARSSRSSRGVAAEVGIETGAESDMSLGP